LLGKVQIQEPNKIWVEHGYTLAQNQDILQTHQLYDKEPKSNMYKDRMTILAMLFPLKAIFNVLSPSLSTSPM